MVWRSVRRGAYYYDGVSIFLLLVVVYCAAAAEVDYATCAKDLEGWCFCSEEAHDCVCTDGLVRFGQPKSEDHPARFLPPEQWNDLQESGAVLCKKATFGRLPDGVDSTNYKMCQCCKDPNNCPAAPPETTPEPAPPETTPEPTCHPPACMESNSHDNDCCGKPDATYCHAGFQKIEWGPGAIECHVGGYFKTCCVPVPTTTPHPTTQADATREPTTTPQPTTTPKPTTTSQPTTVMKVATTVPATTPSPKNATSGPKAPLRNGTKREVMEPAQVKALAGTVSVAVGAAICVAVAATGPAAIAIIGQVQVLTQLGKVGGKADGSNAGALAQFSEGFGWANAELPVSFIGDRRAGTRRKMSVMVGQTYEEATDPACQDKESLTEEQKAKCNGCGLMNGVPLLEKLSVVFGSLAFFFCVRSSLQMIWTKCLRKAPMGALEFPVWEGPLLIVHWFGACESLSHTLGRPCPTWFGIAAVFIIVGPLAFLVFSVFRVGQHLRSGNIVWDPSPPITWSETRVKMAEVKETGYKGILAKIALANAWYSSKRHKGEWVKSPTSRKWLFLIKEFHDSSWKYFAWLALRKLVLAMVMTLTFEIINSMFMIILHVADLALMFCILPHEDNIANLQETWAACTNLVTIVMASLPTILGEMPEFMADSMLIAFALAGTVTAAGGALVGAVGAILGQVFGLCGGLCGGAEVPVDFGVEADLEVEGAEIEEDFVELGDAGDAVAGELMDEAGEIMDGAEDIADEAMNEAGEMMDPGDENEGEVGGGALGLSNSQLAGVVGMAVLGSHLKDPSGQGGAVQGYDDVDFVHVAFKLLLDFVEAGGEGSKERAEFERQLIQDLARASGLKATCFEVEKVEKGSIIAHILIHQDESGEGPGPSSAVALLRQQLHDDSSALRLGVMTQHLDSLECCSPCAHAELQKAVPIACPATASPSRWKSVAGNMQNIRKYANTFAANYFERRSKEEAEKAASKIDTTSVQKKQNQAGADESTLEKVAVKVQARANRSTRPVQKEQIQAGVEKSKFSTTPPSPYFLPSLPLQKGAEKVEARTTRATSSGGGDQSHLSHGSSGSSSVRSKSSTRCRKTLEERADQTQEEMADEERGCHALGGGVAAIDMVRAIDDRKPRQQIECTDKDVLYNPATWRSWVSDVLDGTYKNTQVADIDMPARLVPLSSAAASARKKLESGDLSVRVRWVRHLPKVDTFGKCDPMVRLDLCERKTCTTHAIKSTFEADFSSQGPFIVAVDDYADFSPGVVANVYDWNRTQRSQLLGHAAVTQQELCELASTWQSDQVKKVFRKNLTRTDAAGKALGECVGHDKLLTEIELEISWRGKMAVTREREREGGRERGTLVAQAGGTVYKGDWQCSSNRHGRPHGSFSKEAGIAGPEQEALSRDVEQLAAYEKAPADVLSESHEKLQLKRLLLQYGLEDEAHVLASNGIKKDRDLLFIDEDVLKDLELSPVSKAKLRRLVKAVGALETLVEDSAPAGGVDVYDVCVRIEEETATEKVKAKLVRLISAPHAEDLDGCERSERSVDSSQMLKSSEYEDAAAYEEGPANKAAPIQRRTHPKSFEYESAYEEAPANKRVDPLENEVSTPRANAKLFECELRCGFAGSLSMLNAHQRKCPLVSHPAFGNSGDMMEQVIYMSNNSPVSSMVERRESGQHFEHSKSQSPGTPSPARTWNAERNRTLHGGNYRRDVAKLDGSTGSPRHTAHASASPRRSTLPKTQTKIQEWVDTSSSVSTPSSACPRTSVSSRRFSPSSTASPCSTVSPRHASDHVGKDCRNWSSFHMIPPFPKTNGDSPQVLTSHHQW